jgi:hypothetical protein
MRRGFGWSLYMLTLVLAGCTRIAPLANTGAETAARAYYDAILRKDWDQAFGVVETKTPSDGRSFAIEAQLWRRQLGFEPEQVVMRSCREQGDEATAHVVLKGNGHVYKDVILLHKTGGVWRVVLPPQVGK